MYFKKMVGEKVYLSPRNSCDALVAAKWLNNYEVAKYINQYVKTINEDSEREYLAKNNHEYDYAIVDLESDKLIGFIDLKKVDFISRTATLGVFIGREEYLSRGYGSDAIKLILNFGFNFLNLNNIKLEVLGFNIRAIKAYQKCGFKKFGVWKNSHYAEGTYHDIVFMNVTKSEFNKLEKNKG